jgi:diguanylate cyclase (GGDEF)-like protein
LSAATASEPRVDLRRPGIRDAVIVIGLASCVFLLTAVFAALRIFFLVDLVDERTQLDAATIALLICCPLAVFFGCTRIRHINQEVEARRTAEAKAADLARHDSMTGLANRHFFIEKIDAALAASLGSAGRIAVLVLDIDRFKPVSEMHGAWTADKLLIEFAQRIAAETDRSMLGRIDNDVFALVVPDVRSLDDPTRLARRLMVAIGEPFRAEKVSVSLTMCIGVAVGPDDASTGEKLLHRAELGLREAKADGRNCVRFFEPEMDTHLQERAQVEQELRAAITSSAIILHYQPIFSLDDEQVIGFEALARWRSAKLGWVSPQLFVSIAEECGLMRELGDQLLRRACREAMLWPPGVSLAFNLSPTQSRDRALGLRVLSIADEAGFDPRRLQLEVSDRAVLEDSEAVRRGIEELRRGGVQVALGGFGTGYATLEQLLQLRLDKIKIGRSIVQRVGKDADSAVIVRGMVALAEALSLRITAEGIETRDQLAKLKTAGCPEGQGYLLGKPMPPGEIPTLLRRTRRVRRNGPQPAPALSGAVD